MIKTMCLVQPQVQVLTDPAILLFLRLSLSQRNHEQVDFEDFVHCAIERQGVYQAKRYHIPGLRRQDGHAAAINTPQATQQPVHLTDFPSWDDPAEHAWRKKKLANNF
jgi:hypothetical protein